MAFALNIDEQDVLVRPAQYSGSTAYHLAAGLQLHDLDFRQVEFGDPAMK